jgi:hypothetical protein
MDADGRSERRAIARQFEHDRAPKQKPTAPRRSRSTCGKAASLASPTRATRSELCRVGTKVADERARLGKIARLPALTEHVGR